MAFDLKGALASIAPTLATMLGGPLAGTAVTALEGALGLTQGSGEDGITKVIQGNLTTDQISAIRSADQKHTEVLNQQQIDLQKMNLDYQQAMGKIDSDNVIDARHSNNQAGIHWAIFLLSLLILSVCFYAEIYILFHGYPKEVPDIVVGRILGWLDGSALLVLGYYYGTSNSSRSKDQTISNLSK